MKRKEAPSIVQKGLEEDIQVKYSERKEATNKVITSLLEECLNRSCKTQGISRDYLANLAPGKVKRRVVDDISIMVVNLHN
jgi:hypothetical protein